MYKSLEMVRALKKQGADVHVMMSRHAAQLVSPQLFHAVSQNHVWTKMFDESLSDPMPHVGVLQDVDLVMIMPATASIIGRYAMGLADDLMTTVLLAAKCPVVIAPAMNTAMWEHPIVQENLEKLRTIGVTIVDPVEGELACGIYGAGHLASLETILLQAEKALTIQDLKGKRVLISAGRTEEPLDPVRVLTNRSSGKMGLALAKAAFCRGAEVTVVSGVVDVDYGDVFEIIRVKTAKEMRKAVQSHFLDCDVFISAAAVGDYRPKKTSRSKLKKQSEYSLEMVANPDILKEVMEMKRSDQKVVGFALETDRLMENAQKKWKAKGVDLLVGNTTSVLGEESGDFSLFYGRNPRSLRASKAQLSQEVFDVLMD